MPIAAVFSSHSPLKDYRRPPGQIADKVDDCLANIRAAVTEFKPDLVLNFGPDHFNGFFYRLMPAFCIGTSANSVGDWNTPVGELPVESKIAAACVSHLSEQDVDVALSHRMDVDHGVTQLLTQLFEWQDIPSLVPVFINCAASPLPPIKRVEALGYAIGSFLHELENKTRRRILLTASGGLSHDPPIPQLSTAPAPARERLIAGGTLSPEARAERQEKVLNDADLQVEKRSMQRPLNPAWDQAFLDMLIQGDFSSLGHCEEAEITHAAGCGAHEVRTWIAARSALKSLAQTDLAVRFYAAIPEWVAGFGIATAGLDLPQRAM